MTEAADRMKSDQGPHLAPGADFDTPNLGEWMHGIGSIELNWTKNSKKPQPVHTALLRLHRSNNIDVGLRLPLSVMFKQI